MSPKITLSQLDMRVRHEFEKLLKAAPPRAGKKYQLVKRICEEDPSLLAENIESKILEFYSLPYERRTERQAARLFRIKTYPWLMQQFVLSFATSAISDTELVKVAGRFRHHFRAVLAPPSEIASIEFLHLVLHRTTNPRWDQANTGIDLSIFAERWRRASAAVHGERYLHFFRELCNEISLQLGRPLAPIVACAPPNEVTSTTDLDLTQTDLDWMKEIILALGSSARPPLYPLQRGPQGPTVKRVEQLVRAAHKSFPLRFTPLDEAILRACTSCLRTFHQGGEQISEQSEQQCDTTFSESKPKISHGR